MNEASHNPAPHNPAPPGSGIECRETAGQLALHLPARPGRALWRVTRILLVIGGFFAIFFFLWGEVPPLLFLAPMLGVGALCLAFLLFILVGQNLTRTSRVFTPDSLTLTT